MIEVITSDDCPFCHKQLKIMKDDFFEDEYKVIKAESKGFEDHDCRERAVEEGFPHVVVRDEKGVIRYAGSGVLQGTELRKMERAVKAASFFRE